MDHRDARALRDYHERTKHSVASVTRSRHFLDWEIMPLAFKVYPSLDPLPLPHEFSTSPATAVATLTTDAVGARPSSIDRALLAHLLHFSAGVLRRRRSPNGEVFFRAQACTGNLHHIDLYLICGALADLEPGVYHFSPHDFALRCLRAGDYRAAVAEATGGEPSIARAPAIVACTSTFWRNAWKYQSRTYRHCFWDNGTLLANLLAVARARGVPAHLVLGFADEAMDNLLALDPAREATLSLVALGNDSALPAAAPAVTPLQLETVPLSAREVDYPLIREAHTASSLPSGAAAAEWRQAPPAAPIASPPDEQPLPLAAPRNVPEPIESVILRRGSTRQFSHEAIDFETLSTILHCINRDVPGDAFVPGAPATDLYLIINAVEGLAAGAYVFDPRRSALVLLRHGDFRRQAGHLDLGQPLAADAAVNLYWLVDLDAVFARFGDRGYRVAQLAAAIGGGRTYLAAFALGIGATGLTFFDDDVTDFFSPHAAGKSVLFLMAVGKPARRR